MRNKRELCVVTTIICLMSWQASYAGWGDKLLEKGLDTINKKADESIEKNKIKKDAQSLYQQKEYESALKSVDKGLSIDSTDQELISLKAKIIEDAINGELEASERYLKQGDYNNARKHIKKALKYDSKSNTAIDLDGRIDSVELAEKERIKAEAEAKRKAEADKRKAEADKRKAEADKREAERKAEADKREAERKAEADKREAERKVEDNKREAERKVEADKREAERKVEADKREVANAKRVAELKQKEDIRKANMYKTSWGGPDADFINLDLWIYEPVKMKLGELVAGYNKGEVKWKKVDSSHWIYTLKVVDPMTDMTDTMSHSFRRVRKGGVDYVTPDRLIFNNVEATSAENSAIMLNAVGAIMKTR